MQQAEEKMLLLCITEIHFSAAQKKNTRFKPMWDYKMEWLGCIYTSDIHPGQFLMTHGQGNSVTLFHFLFCEDTFLRLGLSIIGTVSTKYISKRM